MSQRMKQAQERDASSNVLDLARDVALAGTAHGFYMDQRVLRECAMKEYGIDVTKSQADNVLRRLHEQGHVTLNPPAQADRCARFYFMSVEQKTAYRAGGVK